ncbi:two-component sensor histidine kinase [Mycolicibacterium duvalii]|uniref:histidine kinase n=1 Tax=Mycolicibacterium duvalii TaxID=39688 RepID=A0A7I7K7K6_9MYCO|nr:HAMP domain-containing sensor histidine kinase [Mycolicibacterium duvalii]MCV7366070.1 HAMP domain-containing histidine kinase [Mycolicibacterium duvalii]PEG40094.1 two-component sensor histidine kinase [Mycolicibacterium duvalii]BBX19518.1 two-component sensor histidine kinase [Mycolicibacterium duvalii]
MTSTDQQRPLWRRLLPSAARTRIMAWVLLLVLAALLIVTFVTWRLMVSTVNGRMDEALRYEVEEFTELTAPGINPRTGEPFVGVDEVIREAIAYNLARPNEKFLGYVDGGYHTQSRQEPGIPEVLAGDPDFTALVGSVTDPVQSSYEHPEVGEVRYLAIPVRLAGDPANGVIVAAYLGDAERAAADEAARLMLIVGAATVLGATAAAWLIAGRILAPLRDVTETANQITETDLSRRIPSRGEGDELDALVTTVNGMLDRVEAAVSAQRRFIDDAGHELRTPITIIRGHLEVLDAGDPADVAATVALVDDELMRMNRMVSDLLLLARAEQPSFLQPEMTDVGILTREIFDKVTRLGDRRYDLQSVAEVSSVLDPQRITQAMVALADNACRYTTTGAWIGVGSSLHEGWLRFWVSDSGPGVSEADRSRIFERFARGSAGGQRSDGAGLGLSIVAAIAVAHGGRVHLDSIPGRGATFAVTIPAYLEQPWPAS